LFTRSEVGAYRFALVIFLCVSLLAGSSPAFAVSAETTPAASIDESSAPGVQETGSTVIGSADLAGVLIAGSDESETGIEPSALSDPASEPSTLRIEESNRRLERIGSWTAGSTPAASGAGYVYATRTGSSMTMYFRGTSVAWIGPVGPSYGRAEVYIDGKLMNCVSQYATTYAHQRVVWQMAGLADTAHTLTVRVTGQKVAASTGTVVVVDGLDVISEAGSAAQILDASVRHRYPWRPYIVVDKSEFRLYWYRDGRLVKTYPIAHGRIGAATPNAVWRIDSKYLSDPTGVYGPRKMRLYRQTKRADGSYSYVYSRYLIHGTNNPASIGTRASAGCIRNYNANILELFPQVPLGTMVITQE